MSELISKNEVIELIKKYSKMAVPRWDERFTDAYSGLALLSKLLKEIEQMEAIDNIAVGKWIETKEQMPNDHDWVVAVVREIDTGYIWIPRVMEYRKDLNDWLFQNERGWLSDEANKGLEVVAWCPLPEPYNAEEILEKAKPEFEMIPAKLYFRKKLCPECGSDYMTRNSDNIVLMTNPPQYGHHCPTCGHTETYFVQYPEIVYKEEPNEV